MSDALTQAEHDVIVERRRQVEVEGWSAEHDEQHARGELARAAACYIAGSNGPYGIHVATNDRALSRNQTICGWLRWPWAWSWWKPKDRRRDLVRGAALAIAEIERLDRESARRAMRQRRRAMRQRRRADRMR